MLTGKEQEFVTYWSVQRTKKRRSGYKVGFLAGVFIALAIFISLVAGWHIQAMAALRNDFSAILVIVIAVAAIVVFMSLFAARYQWEQREQRYRELLAKNSADKTI